jgi:replicative DNA helicase
LAGHTTTVDYVGRLQSVPCSIVKATGYAHIVKNLAVNRALVKAGARIMEIAGENRDDAEESLAEADSLLRKVREGLPEDDRSAEPVDIIRRLRTSGPAATIPIRFSPALHRLSGGLEPGLMWVIGGFSSTGKSCMAVNLLKDVLDADKWAAVVSTEMPSERYMVRLLSLYSGIPQKTIRDRVTIGLENARRLRAAEEGLSSARLRIFDTTYRLSEIRSRAINMKHTVGLDVLIVDFLQNLRGTHGDQYTDLTESTVELQQLAKELSVTVIVMSQLSDSFSRQTEGLGKDNKGMKGEFQWYSYKGSGAIRDAADFGIILMRERRVHPSALTCYVVKNRDGEMETIEMVMHLPTGAIEEWEGESEDVGS